MSRLREQLQTAIMLLQNLPVPAAHPVQDHPEPVVRWKEAAADPSYISKATEDSATGELTAPSNPVSSRWLSAFCASFHANSIHQKKNWTSTEQFTPPAAAAAYLISECSLQGVTSSRLWCLLIPAAPCALSNSSAACFSSHSTKRTPSQT